MDDIKLCDGERIVAIDSQGLIYRDEAGYLVFLNFAVCHSNWVKRAGLKGSESSTGRCVGERNTHARPPFIDIFGEPVVRFVFQDRRGFFSRLFRFASPARQTLRGVQERIVKAGWSIQDVR